MRANTLGESGVLLSRGTKGDLYIYGGAGGDIIIPRWSCGDLLIHRGRWRPTKTQGKGGLRETCGYLYYRWKSTNTQGNKCKNLLCN